MGKTPMGQAMILEASIGGQDPSAAKGKSGNVGDFGITVTELYPVGRVEIQGKLYDARSNIGKIEKGEKIKVIKKEGFELLVEREQSS